MIKGEFRRNEFTPPHFLADDAHYMITASIYQKHPYLWADAAKQMLLDCIREFCEKYSWLLIDWVILDNHYHMILRSQLGKDLPKLMGGLHRKSANGIKKMLLIECKRFWWNYWDKCSRSEDQLNAMRNYVWYNPVKHAIVDDLKDYSWSSFPQRLEAWGREELSLKFKTYGLEVKNAIDDF